MSVVSLSQRRSTLAYLRGMVSAIRYQQECLTDCLGELEQTLEELSGSAGEAPPRLAGASLQEFRSAFDEPSGEDP